MRSDRAPFLLTKYISCDIFLMNYMRDNPHYSLWDVAVLGMLHERPMHPYEMQRLIKERHKDDVLVLKKGSLYHAINRLLTGRLIAIVKTGREGRRPERTTYRITDEGERALVRWLREMISLPRREPSVFMASVSFLVYLTPQDAIQQLEIRSGHLAQQVAGWDTSLKSLSTWLPRIHLVEGEYLLAMLHAELKWVQGLVTDLKSGGLTWDLAAILKAAAEISAAKKQSETQ